MAKPIITVEHLTKEFTSYKKAPGLWGAIKSFWDRQSETKAAVNDVSFTIAEGEIVGFIGQNGAGKTTTLKMLSGLLYPTHGSVQVLGFNPWDRKKEFLKQFALVMGQKNQLWWDLPPMDTFLLNKEIYEIPDTEFKETVDKLTELLDAKDILLTQVRKLSLGQRMKAELIASLLHRPKILFLDEPTIGLDVVMQKTLRDFIKDYNKTFGATIILTSHYMDDVKELCKRAIVIDKGSIMFDGELDGLIDTYARSKIVHLIFTKPVTKKELEKYGTVKEFDEDGSPDTATLLVPRDKATKLASKALEELPVGDVTIEEAPIEAIIRDVFQDKAAKAKK